VLRSKLQSLDGGAPLVNSIELVKFGRGRPAQVADGGLIDCGSQTLGVKVITKMRPAVDISSCALGAFEGLVASLS
jgi:hypothetical protein